MALPGVPSTMPLQKLLRFARPHAKCVAFAVVFVITGVSCALIPPYLARSIVDDVFVPAYVSGEYGGNLRLLLLLIAGIMAATAGRAGSIYVRNTLLETFSQRVLRDLKQRFYDHVQGLSFDFFHRTRTGELMGRITSDMESLRNLLVMGVMHGATGVFYFTLSSIVLFTINWKLALVAVAASPLLFLTTVQFRKRIYPCFQANREQYSKLNTAVQENVSGIRVVKSMYRYEFESEKFQKENHELSVRRNEAGRVWSNFFPVIEFLSGIAGALMLIVGGLMVIRGSITLGVWVQFNSYLWMLIMPMRMLGEVVNHYSLAMAGAERVFEILDSKPHIENRYHAKKPYRLRGEVAFDHVSWGVDGQEILSDISLHANPGDTIAIMGPTGSGKSSIVHLITRFYDPDRGTVLIDGTDARLLDLKVLRDNIGLVPQETFLFSETMYNNIAYGRNGAPIEVVQRVAAQTQAHMFIRSMTEGYGTVVGEYGVGLSGGQRQRASIARALIKHAPILILDDATSSVDMETEALIQDALQNLEHDVTTFIIAHRISSVRHADEIIILDHGHVAERGTHESLLATGGAYARTFAVQNGDRN
jgi:ATP-binding cassette, subfamily B, multidrug efflux pump